MRLCIKRAMTVTVLVFGLAVFIFGQSISAISRSENRAATYLHAGVSPKSLDFGDQEVQTRSKALRITLTNKSNKPISILRIYTDDDNWQDFEADDECTDAPIEAGSSCNIGITFSPRRVGARSSLILITYDDSDQVEKIPVKGNGVNSKNEAESAKTDLFRSSGAARTIISFAEKEGK